MGCFSFSTANCHGMQFRLLTEMTLQEDVESRARRRASLDACPVHRTGRCSFARHGTCVRRTACGEAHASPWLGPLADSRTGRGDNIRMVPVRSAHCVPVPDRRRA